jgi:hypothetical protein
VDTQHVHARGEGPLSPRARPRCVVVVVLMNCIIIPQRLLLTTAGTTWRRLGLTDTCELVVRILMD